MRCSARCVLMLICLCCLPSLYATVELYTAADPGTAVQLLSAAATDSKASGQPVSAENKNSTVLSEPGIKSEKAAAVEDKAEVSSAETLAGDAVPAGDSPEKKPADDSEKKEEAGDSTFASIQNTGLTVADGDKWYYESFDRQGRQVFAVLYEGGSEIERTVWTYQDTARYPVQKKTSRASAVEVICYDEKGRVLVIEHYEEKKLISKTENRYNNGGKLMEQTVTAGKNTDKSVWDFAGDKAVSQTKYRNGNKIAFIELHTEPHIIHLYFDGKEVFVGEEQ